METLLSDLRVALRSLLKNPGWVAMVVLTLALGIGANTVVFSVVNGVLLRPLPYENPDRIVLLAETQKESEISVSYPNFLDWLNQSKAFNGMAAFQFENVNLALKEGPERVRGYRVTGQFFDVLGVKPVLGRTLGAPEDSPGAPAAVVLSDALWLKYWSRSPAVIGQQVRLNGQSSTVIGVMPASFRFYDGAEIWFSLGRFAVEEAQDMQNRGAHAGTYVVGRLKPGVSLEAARSEMTGITGRLAQSYPATNSGHGVKLVTVTEDLVGGIRHSLLVLFGAVGFVLLIACSNVANLLAVRASGRTREVAIQTAIGAQRSRLVRKFLTESLLLALLGGVVGLILTALCIRLAVAYNPGDIPRLDQVSIDSRVLLFTIGISVVAGLLFGLMPVIQSWSIALQIHLREGSGGGTGAARWHRLRQILVAAEVAASLVLLVGAGLMIQSFWKLINSSPGFDTRGVLVMNIALPDAKYPEQADAGRFYQRLLENVKAIPGVRLASVVTPLPMSGGDRSGEIVLLGKDRKNPQDEVHLDWSPASPDYFRAMSIPLLRGRYFLEQDRGGPPPKVAIVDENLAKHLWGNQDPIGKQFYVKFGGDNDPAISVVGVVAAVKAKGVESEAGMQLYLPFDEEPLWNATLVVKGSTDPTGLVPAIRRQVLAIDSDLPVYNIKTLDDMLSQSVARPRFLTLMLGFFSMVALLLAVLGIYGVVSYTVSQRTRDIGVRIALGAQKGDIRKLVLSGALVPVFIGVAIGVISSLALNRVLASLLFNVSSTDARTFLAIAAVLILAGFMGSLIPAMRAAKTSPLQALRYE